MMNGFNQYICDHCKQPCQIASRTRKFGKGTRWQVCYNCCPETDKIQLCYAVTPQGKVNGIMYSARMDNGHYQLVISYQDNETFVYKLGPLHHKEEIIKIPHCAQGVTPKNIMDKIKLLLLFS